MENRTAICVSIGRVPVDTIRVILDKVDMAEIRIDLAGLDVGELKTVFSGHNNLIATCREGSYDDDHRVRLLETAIISGAAWVDIDAGNDMHIKEKLSGLLSGSKCRLILSRHFFTHTPPASEMKKMIKEMFDLGAGVVKVATQVNQPSDAASLLGLYAEFKNIVVIGMGQQGVITRLASPFLGAPFTFASFGNYPLTASGQIDYIEMSGLIGKISSYG